MGSNFFSDLFKGTSDLLESIPIVGDVLKTADKIALNTDPSQLSTALVGKLIGGDFEDQFTSEEARKGASHTVGMGALAYLLSGLSAGSEAAATPVSESAGAAAESNFAADAAIYGGAEGEALVAAPEGMAGLSTYTMGGAPAVEFGMTTTGAPAAAGEMAPLSSYALGKDVSVIDKLLTKGNINSVIKAGRAINAINNNEQPAPTGGVTAVPGRQVDTSQQEAEINKLMSQALGPDQSSIMFSNKGMTLKTNDQNSLFKSVLGGDSLSKLSSLTSTKAGGDLAFKSRVVPTKSFKAKNLKSEDEPYGLKNVSVVSPFYQS